MAFRIRDLLVDVGTEERGGLFLTGCTPPSCDMNVSEQQTDNCPKPPPHPEPHPKPKVDGEVWASDLAVLQEQMRQSLSAGL